MSDTSKYIEAQEVLSFFKLLNDSNINYVLIKNVGGELPYKLSKSDVPFTRRDRMFNV